MKTEVEILSRLGAIPFWRGRERCFESLREASAIAIEKAQKQLAKISTDEEKATRDSRNKK